MNHVAAPPPGAGQAPGQPETGRPLPRVLALAIPLAYGGMLWIQLLHRALDQPHGTSLLVDWRR
jgi:hypothetical protein